jgi:hypothetical protein
MSSTERNNLEKEVEDAPTPLLDTANEIETSLKNTTQDVSETVTGILTPANIMVVLGFLGIYFGYSFYVSRNRIGVLPMNSSNLQTSLTIDILFFVIIGFVLYALLSSDRFKDQTITSSFLDFITDYLDNPSSVIVSVLILTLLYISIYLFGIPTDRQSKPIAIGLIEIIAWSLLVITVFIDFFKYVFDISFEEFFENLKAYFLGEETVERDDTPLITTTLLDDREVFNVSNNLYTYEDAKAVCKAMDAELATYDQVEKAYNNGAEWCNYGWSDGQMALFPTQKATWEKLQKLDEGCVSEGEKRGNNCGRPGVNGGYIANPYVKFGVNCYGKKPAASAEDIKYMKAKEDQPYPKTKSEIELEKKVNHWKENKNKFLQLNSYNTTEWNSKKSIVDSVGISSSNNQKTCD